MFININEIKVNPGRREATPEDVQRLSESVAEVGIPVIAAAMETIRQNMIVFNYGLLFVRDRRKDAKKYVEQVTRKYGDYKHIRSQIREKPKNAVS